MSALLPGQNMPITGASAEVAIAFGGSVVVDVSAYLLDKGGKVRGDGDMVFYGQTSDASRSVSLSQAGGRGTVVSFDLSRIPVGVERVAVCAAVDTEASPGKTFVHAMPIEVLVAGYRFAPVPERPDILALTLIEIYRRNGEWKVRAVGQGFTGGLAPLSRLYGVEVAEDAPAVPSPTTSVPPVRSPTSAPPTPPSVAPISLSKVSLTKAQPSISLKKGAGSFGMLGVNLNWNRGGGTRRGLFGGSRSSGAVDLDLGCLWELEDGQKGVVQALGKQFGSLDRAPFIRLAGDDRSGDNADGEWLHVAGDKWSRIRRVLVYAYIYDGVPNWASTDGVVSMSMEGQPPVEVRLDEAKALGMCAIALLENVGGEMRVGREVKYFKGHSDMDRAYGWGMRWTAGSK